MDYDICTNPFGVQYEEYILGYKFKPSIYLIAEWLKYIFFKLFKAEIKSTSYVLFERKYILFKFLFF